MTQHKQLQKKALIRDVPAVQRCSHLIQGRGFGLQQEDVNVQKRMQPRESKIASRTPTVGVGEKRVIGSGVERQQRGRNDRIRRALDPANVARTQTVKLSPREGINERMVSTTRLQRTAVELTTNDGTTAEGDLVITNCMIEGRPPTNLPGTAQGDHTVAWALIKESVRGSVVNRGWRDALWGMEKLARYTLSPGNTARMRIDGEVTEVTSDGLLGQIHRLLMNLEGLPMDIQRPGTDFHDHIALQRVSSVVKKYVTLANRREEAVMDRQRGNTGFGGGEAEAMNGIRYLAGHLDAYYPQGVLQVLGRPRLTDEAVVLFAEDVARNIDYIPIENEDTDTLISVIAYACEHGMRAVNQAILDEDSNRVVTEVVNAYRHRGVAAVGQRLGRMITQHGLTARRNGPIMTLQEGTATDEQRDYAGRLHRCLWLTREDAYWQRVTVGVERQIAARRQAWYREEG